MNSALAATKYNRPGRYGRFEAQYRPAGEKRGEWTEGRLAPHVQAAFTRISRRQLEDREHERDEEAQRGQHPEPDGGRSCRRRGRDPAQAEGGDEVEEDEVANAEDTAKASSGWHDRLRASGHGRSTAGFKPACQLSTTVTSDVPVQTDRVEQHGLEQHLQRHLTLQPRVGGAIHLAHDGSCPRCDTLLRRRRGARRFRRSRSGDQDETQAGPRGF